MKIADYGKAITSYIESPTLEQKNKLKTKALLLAERDNFNTPDLEQSPDSFLKPGETLEDFDVTFRKPNSTGGRVQLADGTPPKEKPFTLNEFKDKADIYMAAYAGNALPVNDIRLALDKFTKQGIADGTFTADEAIKVVKDLKSYYQDLSQKQRLRGVVEGIGDVEREEFGEGTKTKLVEFIEKFKLENNRAPTIMEVADGSKSSTASIRKYLKEGVDFIKTDLSEVGKKGGDASGAAKKTGITKLDDKAYKELQDLKIKGVSFGVDTGVGGSKSVRITIQNPEVRNAFLRGNKTLSVTADAKGINQLKDIVEQIAVSDVYTDNVLPFQTDEYKRKIKRLKDKMYKQKDPFGVYKALQKYKTEVFPGDYSKQIQIQHGDAKFTTQTLGRMGLIDADANISPAVEKAERIRNKNLKIALSTLNNPNASVTAKKAAAEKYNSIAKGLRSQLKGTEGQGFVNFQLLEVDDSGNYKKLKDISFDPKKGLVDSDLDLSKITKEQANDLIARGKKKLDIEAVKLKTGLNLKTADKAPIPEKSKTKDMFKKAFQVGKTITKPVARAISPFIPFLGTAGTIMGAADVAEAAKRDLTNEELALAYFTGPDIAEKYSDYKDKPMKQTLAGRENTPAIDDYTGETKSTFGKYNDQIKNTKLP